MQSEITKAEPKELHFEKKTWKNWWKQYKFSNKALREQIDGLVAEHVEWLNKMRELNEVNQMVKDLARRQAQEILELLEKNYNSEEKLKSVSDELTLIKKGVPTNHGATKAITVVKGENDDYSALILTLNAECTEIVDRRMLPGAPIKVAIDQAKIEFITEFDPLEMH